MDNFDCLGEIELPTKQINSQIMINVIEGRDYYKSHIDTYVIVEVPLYFRDKTATSKPSASPSYFKTFIIDLPTSLLNNVLNTHITITVYESHNVLSLTKTAVLGSVVIQMSTIWSEPDKSFRNKWLTLIDYGKKDLGVRGYLKCDIVMFYESHMINNLILSKPLGSTREDITFNKNDLFIPNGFKMDTSHLAKYTIKLHRSEVIRYLYDEGPKWLSIDFGEAPEVSNHLLKK
ncbi:fer-1-like protein 6 [Metopolophium dirhodum]|uniref:fer-1-like protein 6 n=1 Tax=Metopolophium dirhodum TaxID=44670 RepID=UPI00298FE4D4|nr:fer-1-like protein 6 [Metopolophium dirhodum]